MSDLRPAASGEIAGRPGRLYRWGLLAARRKRLVFAVWAVLIAAGLVFVSQFTSSLSMTGVWVPSSDSSRSAKLLARELPATGGNQLVLVFSSRTLRASDPAFQDVVATVGRNVSAVKGVSGVQLPSGPAAKALVAPDGRTALAIVPAPRDEGEATKLAERVVPVATAAATSSVQVGVTGEPQVDADVMDMEKADITRADAVGVPIALLVLLIVFGGLVAAGLPLLLALSGLVLSFGAFGAFVLATGTGLNQVMESVTIMIGLAIGVDYALFVVTRFREELADGATAVAAAATATATAGRTVLVSGATVIVALAPVLLVNDPLMREIVIGPMVAVVVVVAAALSLLPAGLAGLGRRVNRLAPPLPRRLRWSAQPKATSPITTLLLRRPVAVLVSIVVAMAALAAFTLQMRTGVDYGMRTLADMPSGRANSAVTAAFGPGAIAPVQVVFTTGGQPLSERDLGALAQVDTRLRRDPRVRSVTSLPGMLGGPTAAARALVAARTDPALAASLSPIVNTAHGSTLTAMTVVTRAAFDSPEASRLVTDLRGELPAALRGTGMRALVGGASAAGTDLTDEINAKTPLVLALIVVLALLLLAAAFRSLLVALVGLVGTILSVGTAYGLLVLVFQKGAGESIFGFTSPGFIQSYFPLLLFAILVALSTDYQVFLISRIKEEWDRTGDATGAIAVGLQRSGRVILSAAAIMVIVFASFIVATEPELKQLGFALAVVVLIDAALTRRLLIPAALRLLGKHAWGRRPSRQAPPPAIRQLAPGQ